MSNLVIVPLILGFQARKVCHFDDLLVADQTIPGRQIPVDEAVGRQVGHARGDLRPNAQEVFRVPLSFLLVVCVAVAAWLTHLQELDQIAVYLGK